MVHERQQVLTTCTRHRTTARGSRASGSRAPRHSWCRVLFGSDHSRDDPCVALDAVRSLGSTTTSLAPSSTTMLPRSSLRLA